MPVAIGVDFGGTKVLAGVVDLTTGEVLATAKKKSNVADTADQLMNRIYGVVEDAARKAGVKIGDVSGIGVGLAGQIDTARGVLLGAPNLSQTAVDLPMVDLLTERFGVAAKLRNDVQVAAIGEAAFGSGQGQKHFMCVFVGTGIGGAIVQDGELVAGGSGSAGEIGHIVVDANGRLCGCGGRGHLEAYASRTAITAALLGEIRRGRKSVLSELMDAGDGDGPGEAVIRSGILARAIDAEDELALDIVREAGVYLGYGLASVVNLINPDRIILGGGLIESVPSLVKVAERTARRESLRSAEKHVEIVTAALGDNSGIVGAALLNAD